MRKYLLLFLLPVCFIGCNKNDQTTTVNPYQASVDSAIIHQYISAHHLAATAGPNGLYYVETQAGTGGNPASTSTVTVNYKGYYTSGTIFDQSTSAVVFPLSTVIAGWQQGIPLMKKGGKATLLIPSALGYGSQGSSPIPPNTVLVFDVELLDFR